MSLCLLSRCEPCSPSASPNSDVVKIDAITLRKEAPAPRLLLQQQRPEVSQPPQQESRPPEARPEQKQESVLPLEQKQQQQVSLEQQQRQDLEQQEQERLSMEAAHRAAEASHGDEANASKEQALSQMQEPKLLEPKSAVVVQAKLQKESVVLQAKAHSFLKANGFRSVSKPCRRCCSVTSALHRAVEVNDAEAVTALLHCGADCVQKNSKGRTAKELAEKLHAKRGLHSLVVAAFEKTDTAVYMYDGSTVVRI